MAPRFSGVPTKPTLIIWTVDVFQDGAGLLGHGLLVEGEVIEDLGGVARIGAGHHGQHVGADRGDGQGVAAQAAGAARIAGVEDQHAGRLQRGHGRVFVARGGAAKIVAFRCVAAGST